jgi:hypothetical protein
LNEYKKITATFNKTNKEIMKKNIEMPDVIVDLTDETKTVEEAIAECEAARKVAQPWLKRVTKRIKSWFKK